MLLNNSVRTFPCPNCGAILTTGVTSCDVCSASIDAQVAEVAAERRELVLKANGEASSLVMSARMIFLFFCLSLVPFLSPIGRLGVLVLLVQIPWLAVRWSRRYGKLSYPEPELGEARKWWKEALVIWAVFIVATPIWIALVYVGSR